MLRRLRAISVISLLTVGCSAVPSESPQVAATATTCDPAPDQRIIAKLAEVTQGIEGLSGRIVIRRCGRQIFDEVYGFADRSAQVPITRQTIFDVGSLTKQFVAAAIMHLQSQGKLQLEDNLGEFFSGLPDRTASITLHQALTHSSGLPLYSGGDYEQVTREDFVAWLRRVELEYAPGEGESYSNPGFTALALVVERASGQTFEQYLQQHLLAPAGLSNTGYRQVTGPLAINYTADGESDGTPLDHPWAEDGPYWNLMGGGGILSRADEMAIWFEKLHNGQVLSQGATEAIFTGYVARQGDNTTRHGYGWRIVDDERGHWINHGGSNGATFFADVRWFEETNTVMVLTLNTFDLEVIRTVVRGYTEVAAKPATD